MICIGRDLPVICAERGAPPGYVGGRSRAAHDHGEEHPQATAIQLHAVFHPSAEGKQAAQSRNSLPRRRRHDADLIQEKLGAAPAPSSPRAATELTCPVRWTMSAFPGQEESRYLDLTVMDSGC